MVSATLGIKIFLARYRCLKASQQIDTIGIQYAEQAVVHWCHSVYLGDFIGGALGCWKIVVHVRHVSGLHLTCLMKH